MQIVHDHLPQLLLHLLVHSLIVVMGLFIKVCESCLDYCFAFVLEIFNHLFVSLCPHCLNLRVYQLDRFFFDFIAPKIGYHYSLIGEVEFFLVTNFVPGRGDKGWKTIYGSVFFSVFWKKRFLMRNRKPRS